MNQKPEIFYINIRSHSGWYGRKSRRFTAWEHVDGAPPPPEYNYTVAIEKKAFDEVIDLLADIYQVMPMALHGGHHDLIERAKNLLEKNQDV